MAYAPVINHERIVEVWPVAIDLQHTDVGQIVNLPRFRQVRNLPHVADFLRRAMVFRTWFKAR
jgi:hypothetical protein